MIVYDMNDRHLGTRETIAAGLRRTVSALSAAGKRVWLVGPVPEIGYSVPRALFVATAYRLRDLDVRPSRAEFDLRQRNVFELFDELVGELGVRAIWPHQALCDQEACRVQEDDLPIYVDDNHLTLSAARSLSSLFDTVFAR